MRQLSIVSVLQTEDGSQHAPSLEKKREEPEQEAK